MAFQIYAQAFDPLSSQKLRHEQSANGLGGLAAAFGSRFGKIAE
jgi:hypothetical protein